MKIAATVVADSVNEFGNRLTTLLVTMPRYILAEFNTHRMLSKNSASSRAIPFQKMANAVEKNPFIPVAWQKEHKGMQGFSYYKPGEVIEIPANSSMSDKGNGMEDVVAIDYLNESWIRAARRAVDNAYCIADNAKATKQMANRLLEPFMWHTVLVSATEWENFFALRCPQYTTTDKDSNVICFRSWKDLRRNDSKVHGSDIDCANVLERLMCNKGQADIHMMLTAEAIWDAINESKPKLLQAGEWHIPFGDFFIDEKFTTLVHNSWLNSDKLKEVDLLAVEFAIKISTARCAQTSYTVIGEDDKPMDYDKLVALHDRLAKSGHWSPFEHCAMAMNEKQMEVRSYYVSSYKGSFSNLMFEPDYGMLGNFRGFIQYRKLFANENITK